MSAPRRISVSRRSERPLKRRPKTCPAGSAPGAGCVVGARRRPQTPRARLVCYDAFTEEDKNACAGHYFVTFGSQIANPFLKAAHFGNKIVGVNQKYWFHLFNKSDPVLAHRIVDPVPNFEEISWDDRVAGHDAIVDLEKFPGHAGYLQRDLTWQHVYR